VLNISLLRRLNRNDIQVNMPDGTAIAGLGIPSVTL